ncbi:MAG: hypothetical protein GY924_27650, partial [Planctomycetaceae bacterium]|nr:hypothetical protein [Planctomycetaceae bacterium]
LVVDRWVEDGSCSAGLSGDPQLSDPGNGDFSPVPGNAVIDAGTDVDVLPTD